jgi:hypothetical protein
MGGRMNPESVFEIQKPENGACSKIGFPWKHWAEATEKTKEIARELWKRFKELEEAGCEVG